MSQGLYVSASGIKNNQTAIDVISNNIANVNTTAFKTSKANFANLFSSTFSSGSAPTQNLGGTNPLQLGAGAKLSEIAVNHSQGGAQFTGRSSDLLIQGEGYFVSENISANGSAEKGTYFTRAGNFSLDANGQLVTPTGNRIRGTSQIDGNSPVTSDNVEVPLRMKVAKFLNANDVVVATALAKPDATAADFAAYALANGITPVSTSVESADLVNFSMSGSGALVGNYSNGDRLTVRSNPDGTTNRNELIHITEEGSTFAGVNATNAAGRVGQLAGALELIAAPPAGGNPMQGMTMQLQIATFTNKNGLEAIADNGYLVGPNSGQAYFGVPGSGARGSIQAGALETSNVDLASEFSTLIVSQRALEANSRMIRAQSEVLQSIIQSAG